MIWLDPPESHGGGQQGSAGGRYTPGGTPEDGRGGAKQVEREIDR